MRRNKCRDCIAKSVDKTLESSRDKCTISSKSLFLTLCYITTGFTWAPSTDMVADSIHRYRWDFCRPIDDKIIKSTSFERSHNGHASIPFKWVDFHRFWRTRNPLCFRSSADSAPSSVDVIFTDLWNAEIESTEASCHSGRNEPSE